MKRLMGQFFAFLFLLLLQGCSIKKMAIHSLANSLAETSNVYASDEDPELVREALPFGLKTMESLLDQVPDHRGLLVAAASGFTQYAYAFVWLDSEEPQISSAQSKRLRTRARLLFLRARNYAFRVLELRNPGIQQKLLSGQQVDLSRMQRGDVPALYWSAAAWGAAVTQAKGDMDLVADLPAVNSLMQRALELDESFDQGAIHEFYVSYEAARSGGSLEKAESHFARAMELNGGKKMMPLVSFAENISVQRQDRKAFQELLERVLNFDVNQAPAVRLSNLIAKRRAQQLKAQIDDLFLEEE